MGLDACVYCDCVEKGRLRAPPTYPELLYIEPDGSPELRSDDLGMSMENDKWRWSNPCIHKEFCLLEYRLGNMNGIEWIRWVVRQVSGNPETEFPLLWTRVIYNGIHAGDFLTPAEAVQLGAELQRMKALDMKAYSTEKQGYFPYFLQMMTELVEASRLVGKPISF